MLPDCVQNTSRGRKESEIKAKERPGDVSKREPDPLSQKLLPKQRYSRVRNTNFFLEAYEGF